MRQATEACAADVTTGRIHAGPPAIRREPWRQGEVDAGSYRRDSDIAESIRNAGGAANSSCSARNAIQGCRSCRRAPRRQWHGPCCRNARIGVNVLDIVCLSLVEPVEHGLSQKAVEIARPFGFPITNSMVVTWIVAVGLIVFAQVATRRMTQVPGGAQNFLEWLVEGLYGLLESIIGRHLVEKTFWFFGTIFIFILAANWIGLLPGVGTIGWGHHTAEGFTVDQPLFRGANADLNLTLAMALVFFACWIVWALQEVGVRGDAPRALRAQGRHDRRA